MQSIKKLKSIRIVIVIRPNPKIRLQNKKCMYTYVRVLLVELAKLQIPLWKQAKQKQLRVCNNICTCTPLCSIKESHRHTHTHTHKPNIKEQYILCVHVHTVCTCTCKRMISIIITCILYTQGVIIHEGKSPKTQSTPRYCTISFFKSSKNKHIRDGTTSQCLHSPLPPSPAKKIP